ncbi:MAG: coenzyme F420-0:L-glutamate ligase [Candidatus Thorarchaeota archaeon]
MKIEFLGVPTPSKVTKLDQNITSILLDAFESNNFVLRDRDVIIIASKIVSIAEGGQRPMDSIAEVSERAKEIAYMAKLDPRFVETVLQEADDVFGAVPGAVLALRDKVLQANAGVDQSNAGGEGFLIVLPKDPVKTAKSIHDEIYARTRKKVGIIISDSKTHPLRRGTSGFALAVAGFSPIIDDRGSLDLFGRSMRITSRAIADNLVCGAEILMGESAQQVPIVIARGCDELSFHKGKVDEYENNQQMKMDPELCLYMGPLWYSRKEEG